MSGLFLGFYQQLETVAMDVDDLYILIHFQLLSEFGHKNIHRACGEVVIFSPYFG